MVQFNPLHCNARSQCSEMYRQCTEHSQCSSEPPCVYRSLKSSNSVHWQNNAVQPRALPVHCTHTVQLRATLGQTWPQQMSSHSTVGLQSALNFNLQILSALECFRFQNTNKHFNNILTTKSCLKVCLQSAINFNPQILIALEFSRFQNTNKHFSNILIITTSCLTVCLQSAINFNPQTLIALEF